MSRGMPTRVGRLPRPTKPLAGPASRVGVLALSRRPVADHTVRSRDHEVRSASGQTSAGFAVRRPALGWQSVRTGRGPSGATWWAYNRGCQFAPARRARRDPPRRRVRRICLAPHGTGNRGRIGSARGCALPTRAPAPYPAQISDPGQSLDRPRPVGRDRWCSCCRRISRFARRPSRPRST